MSQPPSRGEASRSRAGPSDSTRQLPEALIRTKLFIPSLRAERVARPRLLAQLNAGLTRQLILLAAPAGFGKTTLVADWITQRGLPAAWVTLDARDNSLARFGHSLIAALGTLEARSALAFTQTLNASPPPAIETLIAHLVNVLAEAPDDFVLILDDYHVLTHPLVHAALALLIQRLPPQAHVLIASRVAPPLPLAQFRVRGQLHEVRADDLRFTLDEAESLFQQQLGQPPSAEWLHALHARTEGWAAGLHLAALALQAAPPGEAALRAFTGSHRHVVDYFAEQVLEQQTPEAQTFLLETAVLQRLTAGLCEAVTGRGGGQAMLDHLERHHVFLVPLDQERRWYRYHALFAEFLIERLRQRRGESLAELYCRAVEWHEQNGHTAEAVEYALAAGDAEQAARLMEQIAEAIWRRGEIARLHTWLEALPDAMRRTRPRLCLFHAWMLNILGDAEATEARLRDVERVLAQFPDMPDHALLSGMLAATRAILAVMAGEAERALELSQQAHAHLPAESFVWHSLVARNVGNAYLLLGQAQRASKALTEAFELSQRAESLYMALVSLYDLAELQLLQGRLRQAEATCRRALQLAEAQDASDLVMTGAIHLALSAVLREWNHLDESRQHALIGLEPGRRAHSVGVQICGYTRLGIVEQARGDAQAAERAFAQALPLAPIAQPRPTAFLAHHDAQAYLWARQGDWEAAAHWIESRHLSREDEPRYLTEAARLTQARVLLAQSKPAEALRWLTPQRASAEAGGRTGRVIECLVLEALAHRALEASDAAKQALERALTLAEPEGYVRVFVDEGEAIRWLMVDFGLRIEKWSPQLGQYVNTLLLAFGADPITNHQSKITNHDDSLSERELDVLRLLAAGLATRQIAARLVVAPSTVQTHLKHLYSKLRVHSRTQAIARARELGLLA